MRKPTNLKWKLPLFGLCAVLLGVWVVVGLPCPVRQLTGIICPGCGMSRAWLAVLRLDFAAAFWYHPLFLSVPVVAVFVLYDCAPFKNSRLNVWILGILLAALTVCYILRLSYFLSGNLPL